jgi:hypothetical protein
MGKKIKWVVVQVSPVCESTGSGDADCSFLVENMNLQIKSSFEPVAISSSFLIKYWVEKLFAHIGFYSCRTGMITPSLKLFP